MYAVVRNYEDEEPDVIEQIRARGDDNLAQWVPNPPTVTQGEVALDA